MEHAYLDHYEMRENDVLLDLGATQGDFLMDILPMLKQKNAHLFCVEPELYNLSMLASYIAEGAMQHASVISGMSGAKTGMGNLVVTDQALLHHGSLVDKQQWDYIERGVARVPVYRLQTLVDLCGGRIDFLKCDIEGGEIATFLGSTWDPCDIRNMAIAAYHVVDGDRTWNRLIPFLRNMGYQVVADLHPELPDRDMVYAWL